MQKNSVKQVEQYLKQYSARKPDMAVCVPGIDQIDQQDGKKRPLLMITVEQARQPPSLRLRLRPSPFSLFPSTCCSSVPAPVLGASAFTKTLLSRVICLHSECVTRV